MTDFMYENEKKLKELSRQYFEDEEMRGITTKEELLVCKYMLAYRYLSGGKVEAKKLQRFKAVSKDFDYSKSNLVFFEKLQHTDDLLYLQNYMQAVEKNPVFLSTWTSSFLNTKKRFAA